jgi:hypothetical protein
MAEERMLIEACLARGAQITGSGVEAIPTLRALAARVGHLIEILDPRVTDSPSPRRVVVRRPPAPGPSRGTSQMARASPFGNILDGADTPA